MNVIMLSSSLYYTKFMPFTQRNIFWILYPLKSFSDRKYADRTAVLESSSITNVKRQ
jgi:hypothetical protein